MTGRRGDVQKQLAWQSRIERFRTAGVSVARFCAQEQVSVASFHYWAKKLPKSRRGRPEPIVVAESRDARHDLSRQVQFDFRAGDGATLRVTIPAECHDAIRCVLASVRDTRPESPPAFQQVRVGTR